MIRIQADDELLDVPADGMIDAFRMARGVRPSASVMSDTIGSHYDLDTTADTALYTGDRVAHWGRPGETGEIVETFKTSPVEPFHYYVQWPSGPDPVDYPAHSLIRVTKLES